MKTNFFRRIFLFFVFRNKILNIETDLKIQYNIRIDRIYRLYTVLNIPEQIFEEPYNFRRSDINTMSKTYVQEYTTQLSQFLNANGLTELYVLYDLEKVDKYSYLLVFGYSLINTKRYANRFIYFWTPLILIIILLSLITLSLI